jgi:hypothetical protein
MVVLGFEKPMWVEIIERRGPELAFAVMAEVPTIERLSIEADIAGGRVIATGDTNHRDQYGTAWAVTEALTELWSGFADQSVGLRVTVGALQVDVPGAYFEAGILERRRWATLSSSMLVNRPRRDDGAVGLF